MGPDKVGHLFSKDVVVSRIVRPSRHEGNIICKCKYAKTFWNTINCPFAQIAGKVRGQSGTAPVAKQEDCRLCLISAHQFGDNQVDDLNGKYFQHA